MSSKADATLDSLSDAETFITFRETSEWPVLQSAVKASEFDDVETFVREAALERAERLLDEDAPYICDECGESFPTERQYRGHLGSVAHAKPDPDGDYWCGYCGFGPSSWQGVGAHHGSSEHRGDPIRLDHEPECDELLAPDEVPDHKDPDLLERLYDEHDGCITDLYRAHNFEVSQGRVRHYLIEFDIHEVTPQGTDDVDLEYRDEEWLRERYVAADGNISEMHRQLEEDIPYRTLHNWLKKLGIHDPTDSPGRKQGGPSSNTRVADPDGADDVEKREDTSDGDREGENQDQDATPDSNRNSETLETPIEDVIIVDDPADVEGFGDLETPDWLREASWEVALGMSSNPDEFADNLGWGDPDDLAAMVRVLGCEDELRDSGEGGGDGD